MSGENLLKDSGISLNFKVDSVYQIEKYMYINGNLQGISAKERIRKNIKIYKNPCGKFLFAILCSL